MTERRVEGLSVQVNEVVARLSLVEETQARMARVYDAVHEDVQVLKKKAQRDPAWLLVLAVVFLLGFFLALWYN